MLNESLPPVARRSFLSRLFIGGAAFASGTATATIAQAPAPSAALPWKPGRHPQDDWLDRLPGQHRLVFDTTMPEGFGGALLYANNFYLSNQSGYNLGDAELAVVIVVRHNSTPFAYNEAMWAKYGAVLAQRSNVIDPQTNQAPKVNIYNSTSPAAATLRSGGVTLDSLIKRGVHVAVCQMATRRIAGAIAAATGGAADGIYNELVANLVGNAHMVAAGILALSRAQERGYSFTNVGV
jgi:hypothetical protein